MHVLPVCLSVCLYCCAGKHYTLNAWLCYRYVYLFVFTVVPVITVL